MCTRSARVRARPSSSAILPNSSSIWRLTSTWLDRSSLGSSSLMSRFWTRNLASRNDSRAGRAPVNRDGAACGGAGRSGSAGPPVDDGGVGASPPWGGTGAGTAGTASPSAAGRARSIRFSSDIGSVLPLTACEESALCGLIGPLGGLRALTGEGTSQLDDVARERRLWMRDDERHAAIHGEHGEPTVRDDGAVDSAADGSLDVADPDAL